MPPPANSDSQGGSKKYFAIFRVFRVLVVAYLGALLVLSLFENKLVYLPSHDVAESPDTMEDVWVKTSDGIKIHCWWAPASNNSGAMIFCHGNGGNLSYRVHWVDKMREETNLSVLIFDYPGYGRSEGNPTESGCYASAEAAFKWLTDEQGIAAKKIILFGQSLGGGVASYLAVNHPHRAVIFSRTFTSLPNAAQRIYPWLPARWLMRNQFPTNQRVQKLKTPVIVCHGTNDEVISFDLGKELYEIANEPKLFLPIEGGTHASPQPEGMFQRILQFIEEKEVK